MRGGGEVMQKAIAGLVIGWIVSEVAKDIFEAIGVPKHTATVAGGIIGALA